MKVTKQYLRQLIRESLQQEVIGPRTGEPQENDWQVAINGHDSGNLFDSVSDCLNHVETELQWNHEHDEDPIIEIIIKKHLLSKPQ